MSFGDYYEPPEYPCEVCGHIADNCICPECPVCGVPGEPECYKPETDGGHGLEKTEEQIQSSIRHDSDNFDPTDYF